MKKVCHITTVHNPFDTRIFHKEAKTLAKAGYKVSLITQHDRRENRDGVEIIALPKSNSRSSRILFLTREAYRIALGQRADIYHFHDPEFLQYAVKLNKATGAKIIYDVHEDIPQQILSKEWVKKTFRSPIAIAFNLYEKKVAKKIDLIIVATPTVKRKFQTAGIDNVEVISNYPLLEYFTSLTDNNQKMKNKKHKIIEEREKTLIYVGGLTRERGIVEIVESLDHLQDRKIKLVIIGKFQEKGIKLELEGAFKTRNIEFKGWLVQKEAYQEMRDATIGLVCFLPSPNNINAIPNKIFEYMAAGIPIVASNFPLWKEIIEKNKAGLTVNPTNPKDIARAIQHLLSHPTEARKMGENGKKAVLERYNWEGEGKKLLKIYKSLL